MSWYIESEPKKKNWPSSVFDEAKKSEDNSVEISFKATSDCIESFLELLQHCKTRICIHQ